MAVPKRIRPNHFVMLIFEKFKCEIEDFGYAFEMERKCKRLILDVTANGDESERVLNILTFPLVKNKVIGLDGLNQLVNWLKENDSADGFMFEELNKLFASKACRTAVMIGDTLGQNQMKDIVCALSGRFVNWKSLRRPSIVRMADRRCFRLKSKSTMIKTIQK